MKPGAKPFPFKAVFFDFDGVILESANIKTEAFRNLFKSHPEHADQIVQYHIANMGISRFEKFEYIYKNILKQTLTPEKKKDLGEQFEKIIFHQVLRCPLVPGTKSLLAFLSKKAQLFVVSGTPQAELRRIVKLRKLSPYFKAVYGSPRSKSDLTNSTLKKWSISPKKALFVGDAMTDLKAAKKVGVPFIGRVGKGETNPFPKKTSHVEDLQRLREFFHHS